MSLPITLRAEAEVEFDEAFDFYESRQPGLGSESSQKYNANSTIAANPLMHEVVLADVRMGVVRRFPYAIYFRHHAHRIEVLSVFHSSRDPQVWQARVS